MTDDTPKVQPALTPDEWARNAVHFSEGDFYGARIDGPPSQMCLTLDVFDADRSADMRSDEVAVANLPALIALANAALPDGHPAKITREWVALLREVALTHEAESGDDWHDDVAPIRAIADALESYLPPDTP